jgi:hypothetical protein
MFDQLTTITCWLNDIQPIDFWPNDSVKIISLRFSYFTKTIITFGYTKMALGTHKVIWVGCENCLAQNWFTGYEH